MQEEGVNECAKYGFEMVHDYRGQNCLSVPGFI